MSNDKKIIFSAHLDDAQLVQDIQNVQRKMKEVQDQLNRQGQGMKMNKALRGGGLDASSEYTKQSFENATIQRNMTAKQSMIEEVRLQERLKQVVKEKTDILSQQNILDRLTSNNKSESIKEEIKNTEKLIQLSEKRIADMGKAYKAPGGSGGGLLGALGSAAGTAGILSAIQQVATDYAQRPMAVSRAQGTAVAGTTGRVLSQMQSGEYTYEGMFGEERQKAVELAKTSEKRSRGLDIGLAAGGAGALAIGGLMAAGVIGTGGLGAIPLALMGLGGAGLFSQRKQLDRERYNAEKAAEYSNNFNEALESQKEMAPFKKDAIEKLKKNGPAYLNYQRTLGLSDEGMFGGFRNLTRSGFTEEMGMNASSAILGAGGSTGMAGTSGQSIALKAARQLGLTNSTGLLGMISGTQGNDLDRSKNTLIDIFARGQAIGLDSSRYAAENRRFMESVAESVNKGGVTSEAAAETVARIMGSFAGGSTTMRGLEAGRTAYEAYQNVASSTSGYTGALNIAGLMSSDARFKNIKDPAALQTLLELKPNEIDRNSPEIRSMARQLGMTPAELENALQTQKSGAAISSLNRSEGMSKLTAKEKEYRAAHGGTMAGFEENADLSDIDFAGMMGMAGRINPNLDAAARRKYVIGLADQANMSPEELKNFKSEAQYKFDNGGTGRAGDTIIQASAKNAQVALETLSGSINTFAADALLAAGKIAAGTGQARTADAALHEAERAASAASSRAEATADRYGFKDPTALIQEQYSSRNLSKTQAAAEAANKNITNK